MGKLITLLSTADSPVLIVVISVALTFVVIKELFAAIKWIKERLDGYHNVKNQIEDKEENIESRIKTLENHDAWQYRKLNQLGEELEKVISMIQTVQDTQAKTIIDTYKGTIFRIYHDNVKQGCITQTELDRFIDLVKVYREAGGDGIVDEKVYPEVLALPIANEK